MNGQQITIADKQQVKPDAIVLADPESIVRFAIEKQADIGTLERVLALRDKLKAEWAKAQFDKAMADFQSECPVIEKRKEVKTKTGGRMYKYAPMDDILTQKVSDDGLDIRGLIRKHGFSYSMTSQSQVAAPNQTGWVESTIRVTHKDGHSESSSFKVPTQKSDFITDAQTFAVALTFSSRYAFRNAFGLVTTDEDTDGRTEKDKPRGPSSLQATRVELQPLVQELWDILKPYHKPDGKGGYVQNWKASNRWMLSNNILREDEEAPFFTAERFKEVIESCKGLIASLGGKK